jgi:hypothetical protein
VRGEGEGEESENEDPSSAERGRWRECRGPSCGGMKGGRSDDARMRAARRVEGWKLSAVVRQVQDVAREVRRVDVCDEKENWSTLTA